MSNARNRFEGLLDRYFETLLADSPTYAATLGIRTAEGKLGGSGPRLQARRERERQAALRMLDDLSPRELSNEQQLDRLGLRSLLLRECEDFARDRHKLEPAAPAQLLEICLHELLRSDDEPRRAARNLRSLLRLAPDFLEEATTLLRRPERVWLRVMEDAVVGSASLLAAIRHVFGQHQPQSGDGALLVATQKALDRYRDHATRLPLAPERSFAIGDATLRRRIRDEVGLDYTPGQVEALALAEADRMEGLLRKACARFGRNGRPAAIIARLRREWRPQKPLLELYAQTTRAIAGRIRSARIVSFPSEETLVIKPVPAFLRTITPTAAYTQPGAFERRQRGIFWVNDFGESESGRAGPLAERQQHFGLPLTCAHEAYPGHHLQLVTANLHPRKWRRLFAHAVFYEGWTLWCEQMMVDLRVDRAPWLRLQQLHDALWRVHRILVDLRLQSGRYTHAQGAMHLQRHLGFTRARAEADVNWYTAQPCVPMSYWLGRLENARLHARLVEGRGWSLQRFNDWLLSFGTLPQAWIEKYGLD